MSTTTTKTPHNETSSTGSGLYGASGSTSSTGSTGSDATSTYGAGSSHYGSGASSYGTSSSTTGASGTASKSSGTKSSSTIGASTSGTLGGSDTDDNGAQIRRMVDGSREMAHKITDTVEERPVAALIGVAGVSFIAGSLLGSRIGQLAIAIGIGYIAANVLRGEGGLRSAIDQLNPDNA